MRKIPLGLLVELQHSSFHLGDHGSDFAFGDAAGRSGGNQVGVDDVAALAVDHGRVFAVEPGTGRQVVGRGEMPLVFRRQQEREILAVVITVTALYVENHPPDHLLHIGVVAGQGEGELQQILVIQRRISVRGVQQSAGGMDMDFALRHPVEPADTKTAASVFQRKKMCLRHIDPGGFRGK